MIFWCLEVVPVANAMEGSTQELDWANLTKVMWSLWHESVKCMTDGDGCVCETNYAGLIGGGAERYSGESDGVGDKSCCVSYI